MDGFIQWSPGVNLEALERQAIQAAFKFFQGNKTATANSLGIAIRTLDAKLEKYQELEIKEVERIDHDKQQREHWLARARGERTPDNVFTGTERAGSSEVDGRRNAEAKESAGEGSSDKHAVARMGLESLADLAEEPAMSLSERKEIQGMPSKSVATSSSKGRR